MRALLGVLLLLGVGRVVAFHTDWSAPAPQLAGVLIFDLIMAGLAVGLIFGVGWLGRTNAEQPDQGADAPPPPEKETDWRDRVATAVMVPLRLAGVAVLVAFTVPGLVAVWDVPSMAKSLEVEQTDLAVRTVQQSNAARPFFPLGYSGLVRKKMIDLTPDTNEVQHTARSFGVMDVQTAEVTTEREKDGVYAYYVTDTRGGMKVVKSETVHFQVAREDLLAAEANVGRVYDAKDKATWAAVDSWGENLFWTCWVEQNPLGTVPKEMMPKPEGGTEAGRKWCVWQVMAGKNPEAEKELPRLEQLFAEAFPDPKDRDEALRWAKTFLDTQAAAFRTYLHLRPPPGESPSEDDMRAGLFQAHGTPLPPDCRTTHLWMLYRFVGLTPASREAAKAHWLSCFPSTNHDRLQRYGERLERERRDAGEPLPNVPDTVPLLCAVERLNGSDGVGRKCREALVAKWDGERHPAVATTMRATFPSDEFYFLAASGDRFQMYTDNYSGDPSVGRAIHVGTLLVLFVLSVLGLRTLTDFVLARLVVHGRGRKAWGEYKDGRGRLAPVPRLVGVTVAAVGAALAAVFTMPDAIAVQLTFEDMVGGAVLVTAAGGLLIGAARRVAAVFIAATGANVEKSWLDQIVGIGVGVAVLAHFGNDPANIVMAVFGDVLTEVLLRLPRYELPTIVTKGSGVFAARRAAPRRRGTGSDLLAMLGGGGR